MTYCCALRMDRGLIFMADTRTNAGLDNISTYRKLFSWSDGKDAHVTIMTAGNLATTQSVVSLIEERRMDGQPEILRLASMFQVARYVGALLKEVISASAGASGRSDGFGAQIIVGGEIRGGAPRLFMVYPEGNFIEAGDDTPFLQIGETKYGRPILVRAFDPAMTFEAAFKLLCLSFDSTIKANLSVGLPLDGLTYEGASFSAGSHWRVENDDSYFHMISSGWDDKLKDAFLSLPDPYTPRGAAE